MVSCSRKTFTKDLKTNLHSGKMRYFSSGWTVFLIPSLTLFSGDERTHKFWDQTIISPAIWYGLIMQYLIRRRHACSYDFQNWFWLVWFDSILIQAKNKKEKMLTNRYSSRRQHNIKILQQELKSLKVQARFRTATTSGPFMICGRYWSETI